jgi:hypothetical protein
VFHKKHLGDHADQFPHDRDGFVPTDADTWRTMNFEQEGLDPDEQGISAEERAHRIEYLDRVWWPRILAEVHDQRLRLVREHGKSFMERWAHFTKEEPDKPHGFGVKMTD